MRARSARFNNAAVRSKQRYAGPRPSCARRRSRGARPAPPGRAHGTARGPASARHASPATRRRPRAECGAARGSQTNQSAVAVPPAAARTLAVHCRWPRCVSLSITWILPPQEYPVCRRHTPVCPLAPTTATPIPASHPPHTVNHHAPSYLLLLQPSPHNPARPPVTSHPTPGLTSQSSSPPPATA